MVIFFLTGNSRIARPVKFIVNKGDRSIRCFSQFRNELLRIRQGRDTNRFNYILLNTVTRERLLDY